MSQPRKVQGLRGIPIVLIAACVAVLMFASTGHARIVQAAAGASEWVEVTQILDDYAWPSEADPTGQQERGYRYYGRLAADRGDMGDGLEPHSLTVADGVLTAQATSGPQGTSWVGRWHSTSHTALEKSEVLNFAAPLSGLIEHYWQPQVSGLYVRAKGTGTIKMELKDSTDALLAAWTMTGNWGPGFQEVRFPIANPSAYPAVKLINLVVESPSLLDFAEVGMTLSVPKCLADDTLRYTFATSYGALLRGYDPASGYTRDHVHWPAGDCDSIPGCGFQALGAAVACDLGLLPLDTARGIVSRSVAALHATPKHQGLLPHWMEHGVPKDWSTVDTALALEASLLACTALDMSSEGLTVLSMIGAVNWTPLTNAQGQVAHGYAADLSVSPYYWVNWDGEGAVVQLLRLIQTPSAPLFNMDICAWIYGGRGFIAEIAGLFAPQFGVQDKKDIRGVNWLTRRMNMLAVQKAYYPQGYPDSLAGMAGLYGLSPIETIDDYANTAYLEAGVGNLDMPAEDGGGWVCPHYAAMAADLDVDGASAFFSHLRQMGVLQPLIGLPEGVLAGRQPGMPERWHSGQITLNGFFNVLGTYHAIRVRDGGKDIVYQAAQTHPRLVMALKTLFP